MKFRPAVSSRVNQDKAYQLYITVKRTDSLAPKTLALLKSFFLAAGSSKLLNHRSVFEIHKGFQQSHLVDINELDDIVTEAMFMSPRAFNKDYFGGTTQKKKLKYIHSRLGKRKVLNRSEAQYLVNKRMGLFKDDRMMGSYLKKRTGL